MRILVALLFVSGPAYGWEFTVDRLCRLSHDTGAVQVEVTYDPSAPEYAIHLTRDVPWAQAPVFGIQFSGIRPITITTDRQVLTDGGRTLSVYDTGFGNVLDGLQYNERATALIGETAVDVGLSGAAEPVAAFRTCTSARLS